MPLANFGGSDYREYSLGTIIGWLDSIVEAESEACETSASASRKARLEAAEDARQLLHEVADWTAAIQKHRQTQRAALAKLAAVKGGQK